MKHLALLVAAASLIGIESRVIGQNPQAAKHQVILLHLTDHGFQPSSLSHPMGQTTIIIYNESRTHDIALSVERVNAITAAVLGPPVKAAAVAKEQRDYRDSFDFTPGTYELRDTRHPTWSCRLTITAK